MRTALRTALATALVAGVAATPVLAAGSAFATGMAPAPTAATAKPTAPMATAKSAASARVSSTATATAPAAAPTATAGAATAPAATAPATTAPAPKPTAATAKPSVDPVKGTFVRTQTLITGTVAKIYKVNALHYRAELFRKGHPVGVLQANTRSVAGQDNGEFFVLKPDGTTYNWVGNIAPGTPGIYRLVDGTVVELGRKNGSFGLQRIDPATDKGSGYVYVHGGRKVYFFGKAVVVLEQDGRFAAYVPGFPQQAAPQPYGMGGGGDQGDPTPVVTQLGPCTVSTTVSIGAGTSAELFMTRQGPVAEFSVAGEDRVFALVDRAHPSLPKSVGITARIIDPNSTTPSLYTKVEGGPELKGTTRAFPRLPKGCTLETLPGSTSNGTAGSGKGATVHAGQTSVIPRGGVAAGAELGTEDDSTALLAAGAGASLAAAGLGFVVLRRRTAARD
ncbi:hypothetical protein ACWFR1_30815 [Streptomyces sp. NPDC055103]